MRKKIDIDSYELEDRSLTWGRSLGGGVFATVKEGSYQQHGITKKVAVKTFWNEDDEDAYFEREVRNNIFLREAGVKNIATFQGWMFYEGAIRMIFDLYVCSLDKRITSIKCGLILLNDPQIIMGNRVAHNGFYLFDTYDGYDCFFYYDTKTRSMTTIEINFEQYQAIRKIYDRHMELKTRYKTDIFPYDYLLPEQIEKIEQLTGFNLKRKNFLPFQQLQHIAWQAAFTLKHCADIGVVLADIKPENMLLTENGDIKFCDFGLSSCPAEDQLSSTGSPYFMAPEILNEWYLASLNKPRYNLQIVLNTHASDTCSLVHVFFCMLVIYEPFPYTWIEEDAAFHEYVVIQGRRHPFPPHFKDDLLKELIEEGWAKSPLDRLTPAKLFLKIDEWIKKTSPDLGESIRMEQEKVGCKASDTLPVYSQSAMGKHGYFKPKPLIEDPVVSDCRPGFWR